MDDMFEFETKEEADFEYGKRCTVLGDLVYRIFKMMEIMDDINTQAIKKFGGNKDDQGMDGEAQGKETTDGKDATASGQGRV